jgi:Pantothenate kinase, acetyl-CoA regulated
MSLILGLDIGGSTTKVVGLEDGKILEGVIVKASDPLGSAYAGLGRYLETSKIKLSQIDMIMATGVGASYLSGNLLDRKTILANEFESVGIGGIFLAGIPEAVVVSMGTGTSLVEARGQNVRHIIGSGVGGGTLLGLADRLLNVTDFETIDQLSQKGHLEKIDLTVGDLTQKEISGLTPTTTASNFGKLIGLSEPEDVAAGIVNLVFQSVGTAAVLAARLCQLDTIVVTGNLTCMSLGRQILDTFNQLYGVAFVIPDRAVFATATGAALQGCQFTGY